jgi:hypothetical protein
MMNRNIYSETINKFNFVRKIFLAGFIAGMAVTTLIILIALALWK